jgi:hypothetical protein
LKEEAGGTYPQVVLAAPFRSRLRVSEHGGESLADLAADSERPHDASMFRPDRLTCRSGHFFAERRKPKPGAPHDTKTT